MVRLLILVLVLLALPCRAQDRALPQGRVTHLGPGPWDDLFQPYDSLQEALRDSGVDLQIN